MNKHNQKPELDMFTLLNPEFYGVLENQFNHKRAQETSVDSNPENEEETDDHLQR